MTLSELIEHLSMLAKDHDFDDIEVMIAREPSWPLECHIAEPVLHDPLWQWEQENALLSSDDPDYDAWLAERNPDYDAWLAERNIAEAKPKTIFIPESGCRGYLPGGAVKLLGWGRRR